MHISEGVLSWQVITGGYALTAVGVGAGLRYLKDEKLVRTAVMSAAFFVASLIHIPVGVGNVHLILNGLVGLILGPLCFCAMFVALLLQALIFQFGGVTSLGVNTFNMAMPAFFCYLCFFRMVKNERIPLAVTGFLSGFLSILLSAFLLSLSLRLSGEQFDASAKVIFIAHIPVMIIEGIVTAVILQFIKKVKPELL